MFHKRVVQYPLLQAFDGPDAAVSCGRRNITTVAPQALALLNDPFVRDRAADFADGYWPRRRDPRRWVDPRFELALGRPPSDAERAASVHSSKRRSERRSGRESPAPESTGCGP